MNSESERHKEGKGMVFFCPFFGFRFSAKIGTLFLLGDILQPEDSFNSVFHRFAAAALPFQYLQDYTGSIPGRRTNSPLFLHCFQNWDFREEH